MVACGVDFESRDTVGNVFANGAYRIMKKAGGYRWLEKDGSWIDVNAGGQIVASGHRARTIVRYVYNATDQLLRVTNDAGDQNYVTFPNGPLPVLAPDGILVGRPGEYRARDWQGRVVTYTYRTYKDYFGIIYAVGGPDVGGSLRHDNQLLLVEVRGVTGETTEYVYHGELGVRS